MTHAPFLSLREAALLARGASGRVFVAGSSGEPGALIDTVLAEPELWAGVTVTGPFIPGVNDRDLTAGGSGARAEVIFTTGGLAPGTSVSHMPLSYSAYWARLAEPGHVGLAYVTVPPPRGDGTIGLGLASDFAPAVIASGARLVGIVNPAMPEAEHGARYPAERFHALAEGPAPLATYDPGPPDPVTESIARHIAMLLRPGDTLQLGLGRVQGAVLRALVETDIRKLSYHSGMISAPIIAAMDAGVFDVPVTTGVALGDAAFYHALRGLSGIRLRSVGETHDGTRLAAIPGFVAVNSVLEIDLMGQANAEFTGGRRTSGKGGLLDFLRGARASAGGRAILALPATAKGGTVSRIVPTLAPELVPTVSASEVQIVVTEHGVADLAGAKADERAMRLIAIAAPAQRDALANAWDAMRRDMR